MPDSHGSATGSEVELVDLVIRELEGLAQQDVVAGNFEVAEFAPWKLAAPAFGPPLASATADCTVRQPRSTVFQRMTVSVAPPFT